MRRTALIPVLILAACGGGTAASLDAAEAEPLAPFLVGAGDANVFRVLPLDDGSTIAIGESYDAVTLRSATAGPVVSPHPGGDDLAKFFVRYDRRGDVDWIRWISNDSISEIEFVQLAPGGAILVLASFFESGTLFGEPVLVENTRLRDNDDDAKLLLARLDRDGTLRSVRTLVLGDARPSGLSRGEDGSLWLALAHLGDHIVLDPGTPAERTVESESRRTLMIRYDAAGERTDVRPSTGDVNVTAMTTRPDGDLVAALSHDREITLLHDFPGAITLPDPPARRTVLLRVRPGQSSPVWMKDLEGDVSVGRLLNMPDGFILAGTVRDEAIFGARRITAGPVGRIGNDTIGVIARIMDSRNLAWARTARAPDDRVVLWEAVALPDGGVLAAGLGAGATTFEGAAAPLDAGSLLVRYTANGEFVNAHALTPPDSWAGVVPGVAPDGSLVLAGTTTDGVRLPDGTEVPGVVEQRWVSFLARIDGAAEPGAR